MPSPTWPRAPSPSCTARPPPAAAHPRSARSPTGTPSGWPRPPRGCEMAAMSPIAIEDIPPVGRAEATSLAATEYDRFAALLRALPPEAWDLPTDCTRCSVKDVAAHIVGETEAFASPREFGHQWLPAARVRREVGSPWLIDGVNEVQVRD